MSQKHSQTESGFVSIIVAALIMVILSLITIGFTRVMQREQRQSLDRQLTRQALYAAESGINDVFQALQADTTGTFPVQKVECDVSDFPNGGVIDADNNVAYTCATYDKTPGELTWSLGTSESAVTELKTASGLNFDTITIRWGNEQGNNNVGTLPACGPAAETFPAARAGNIPMLRFDISNTSTLNRDALINGTDYLYIAPCNGGGTGSHSYASTAKGTVVQVPCINDPTIAMPCELTIDNLNGPAFFGRLRSIYDSSQVAMTATEDNGGTPRPAEFAHAQTSIDVTAKAGDVVRRLRVSMPLSSVTNAPESVFQSFDGVCKLLSVDTVSSPVRLNDNCPAVFNP